MDRQTRPAHCPLPHLGNPFLLRDITEAGITLTKPVGVDSARKCETSEKCDNPKRHLSMIHYRGALLLLAQLFVKLASLVERGDVAVSAVANVIDEDLRHRVLPRRFLKPGACLGITCDIDFLKSHALLFQERLRHVAIRAKRRCVDFYLSH